VKSEFQVDPGQVPRLRAILSERVGYELPAEFESFIQRQAASLCVDLEITTFFALIQSLDREDVHSPLWVRFISRMTIGESYLFRNPNHMELLQRRIIPRLVEKSERAPVRIWSAGCARGEEPYTLAILLLEHDPNVVRRDVRIVATDIDADALESAREAFYGAWAFRQTPYHIQRKYFARRGRGLVLHPSVRSLVDFGYHHVAVDRDLSIFPHNGFDLILCRNLLMYLRPDFRAKAGRALASRLTGTGMLLPGQVERIDGADDLIDRMFVGGSAVYCRSTDTSRVSEILTGSAPEPPLFVPPEPPRARRISLSNIPAVHKLRTSTVGGVGPAPEGSGARATPPPQPRFQLPEPEVAPPPVREPPTGPDIAMADARPEQSNDVAAIRRLMLEGQSDDALSSCLELVEAQPLEALHHALLALVHLDREHQEPALAALRKAIYLDPDGLTAYYIWWLIGVRYRGVDWDRTQWARRHLARLVAGLPDDHRIPLVERVTAGDIRYLLQRDWDTFRG